MTQHSNAALRDVSDDLGAPLGVAQDISELLSLLFEGNCERRKLKRGERLFTAGNKVTHVAMVTMGVLRRFHCSPSDDREALSGLYLAPSLLGHVEALAGAPHQTSAAALKESEVLLLPRNRFLELTRNDVRLMSHFVQSVSQMWCDAQQSESFLAFNDVEQRLASLVLTYVRCLSVETGGAFCLSNLGGTQELARNLGVNRRSIHRTIERWLKQGWVSKKRRLLYVHNLDAIERVAGDSEPLSTQPSRTRA